MAAQTLDAVVTTGGRFGSGVYADDAGAVVAAVRRGIFQACRDQLHLEVHRLRPVIASGSDDELAAALRPASLALADAAAAVDEADDALRLRGLTDYADSWPNYHQGLKVNIHCATLILTAMQRNPPELARMHGVALLPGILIIGDSVSNWGKHWGLTPPSSRPRPTPVVDGLLASGIQAVQISSSSPE